jgi:hypothetical protein
MSDFPEEEVPPVHVPHSVLSPEALQGVIESFVLREGTDYGEREVPLETKVSQVRRQLDRGEVEILYDPNTQSINLAVVVGRSRSG